MKNKKLLFGLSLLIILGIILNVNATWSFYDWSINGRTTGFNSLEVTTSGTPCYLFKDTITNQLIYECLIPSTDKVVFYGFTGTIYNLALDSINNPHICFVNGSTVYYSRLVGGTLTIDTTFNVSGSNCLIDTDVNNKPHIIYTVDYMGGAYYLYEKFLITTWITSLIDTPYGEGITFKIGIDNQKYLTYYDGSANLHITNTSYLSTTYSSKHIAYSRVAGFRDSSFYLNTLFLTTPNNIYFWDSYISPNNGSITTLGYSGSLATYNGNIYITHISAGILYETDNSTGSFVDTIIDTASNSYTPTIAIDLNGNKWVTYTSLTDTVMLAYEVGNLVNLYGKVFNGKSFAPIYSALICFNSYCAYSDSNGNWSLSNSIDTGLYNVTVSSNNFGVNYITYSELYIVDSLSDENPINFYLFTQSDLGNNSNNAVTVKLTFIDWDENPISNISVGLEYMNCLTGCTACCSFRGNKYISYTNNLGEIILTIPKGEYKIYDILGEHTFFDNQKQKESFYLNRIISTNYNEIIYTYISNKTYNVNGKVSYIEDVFGLKLGNVSISLIDEFNTYFYTTITNESGNFNIPYVYSGRYLLTATKNGYSQYSYKNIFIGVPCYNYTTYDYSADCDLYILMKNSSISTYKINGTIKDIDSRALLNARVVITGQYNTNYNNEVNASNGKYSFDNIPLGQYLITAFYDNYQFYCDDKIELCSTITQYPARELYLTGGSFVFDLFMQNLSNVKTYCINGSVTNINGTKLQYARVYVSFSDATSGIIAETLTNNIGDYSLCELQTKCYQISASSDTYGITTESICLTNNTTIDLVLESAIPKYSLNFNIYDCESLEFIPSRIKIYNNSSKNELIEDYNILELGNKKTLPENSGYYVEIIPNLFGYDDFFVYVLPMFNSKTYTKCLRGGQTIDLTLIVQDYDLKGLFSDAIINLKEYNTSILRTQKTDRYGVVTIKLLTNKEYSLNILYTNYTLYSTDLYGTDLTKLDKFAFSDSVTMIIYMKKDTTEQDIDNANNQILSVILNQWYIWLLALVIVLFPVYIVVLMFKNVGIIK